MRDTYPALSSLSAHNIIYTLVQALASVGAIVGGPAGGWVADYWGRKCSLMFSGLPIATGYLLLSYAHFSSAARGFVITLYIGRFMTGLGMGAYATCISVSEYMHPYSVYVYQTKVLHPILKTLTQSSQLSRSDDILH